MLQHVLSVLVFMMVSFAVQGMSHFVINKGHFDGVGFMRTDPIIPIGLTVMVIQGLLMSFALATWKGEAVRVADGLWIAFAFGVFLVSYIALVEPSKYSVPSVADWVRVEGLAGVIQFAVFGLLLGWIHTRF